MAPVQSYKQFHKTRILSFALLVVFASVVSAPAGTLTGTVITASGQTGVKDSVVWVEPKGEAPTFQPSSKLPELSQMALQFQPAVLPVLVGTTVSFPNRDTTYHSVYSFSRKQRFEIGLYRPGETRTVKFDKTGEVKIFCNIHHTMRATVLVLPTPYFSKTDANGAFTISNLPAGDYTVKVWRRRLTGKTITVSIPSSGSANLTLALREGRKPAAP